MVGPPCSGKTTKAKRLAKASDRFIRVNRDELRTMMRGHYVCDDLYVEKTINLITEQMIQLACASLKNVIIDATHCKVRYINDIKRMIPEGCPVEFKYVLAENLPLWILKLRNIKRYIQTGVWIPKKVMENMYHNFQLIRQKIINNEI